LDVGELFSSLGDKPASGCCVLPGFLPLLCQFRVVFSNPGEHGNIREAFGFGLGGRLGFGCFGGILLFEGLLESCFPLLVLADFSLKKVFSGLRELFGVGIAFLLQLES
jgi:hypothetical protein